MTNISISIARITVISKITLFVRCVENMVKLGSTNELPNGILALKGGDLVEELDEMKLPYHLIEISSFFEEEFF